MSTISWSEQEQKETSRTETLLIYPKIKTNTSCQYYINVPFFDYELYYNNKQQYESLKRQTF